MLENLKEIVMKDVLSDMEIEQGNKLLLYLHCCLAGKAFPYGSLPPSLVSSVPLEVCRVFHQSLLGLSLHYVFAWKRR